MENFILSPLIHKGMKRAAQLHHGQMRKDKKTPFIIHPFAVGFILSSYTNDENTIVAGFLHDVLEDVEGYTYEEMCKEFSKEIASIVKGVTRGNSTNWEESSKEYLENLASASNESVMVSVADKIHNIASSIDGVQEFGDKFWDNFVAQPKDYIWFYNSVLEIAEDKLDNKITQELENSIEKLQEI